MRLATIIAIAAVALSAGIAAAAELNTGKDLVAACGIYAAKDENALRDPDPCRRFLVGFFTAFKASEDARRDSMVKGLPAASSTSCIRLPDFLSYREMA